MTSIGAHMRTEAVFGYDDLTQEQKRRARHDAGFGCVRCGVTIFHYVGVPRENGGLDDPPQLALLCPACLDRYLSGSVTPANLRWFHGSPIAGDPFFDRGHLPYTHLVPALLAGGPATVRQTPVPVMLGPVAPLRFDPPRSGVGAVHISVTLGDEGGVPVDIVIANEWSAPDATWRFIGRSGRYMVESTRCDSQLILDFPSRDSIVVTLLRTTIAGKRLELTPDYLDIDGDRRVNAVASRSLVGFSA